MNLQSLSARCATTDEPHKLANVIKWTRVHDAVADPERKRDEQLTTTAVWQSTSSSRQKRQ
jgi:hypothetical protein